MSSYHAWTHAPKAQGGTDPIPGLANNRPWVRRSKQYTVPDGLIVPDGDESILTFPLSPAGEVAWDGSDDVDTYFERESAFQTKVLVHGYYDIYVEGLWDTDFPENAWFNFHDTLGFPTSLPSSSGPAGGGSLGGTSAAFWTGRYPANYVFQVDTAHGNAANQLLVAYYIEIRYVGDYTGPERIDSTVWDQ